MKSIGSLVRRHPFRASAAAVLVAGAVAFALYWFAPWQLFAVDSMSGTSPWGPGVRGGAAAHALILHSIAAYPSAACYSPV